VTQTCSGIMLAPDCSEEFRQASMRRRSGERGSLRFPPARMEGFAGYSYYLRGRIALRRVPAEVYYGYRFHDDAVHAVAEVVTDRKRRPKGETPTSLEKRLGSRYTGAPFVGEAPRNNLLEDDNFVMVEKAAPDLNPFALGRGPLRTHEGPSLQPFRRQFWTDGCHLATGRVVAGRCNKFPSPIASNWGPAVAP
jgi:hypothetical protein